MRWFRMPSTLPLDVKIRIAAHFPSLFLNSNHPLKGESSVLAKPSGEQ